MPDINVGVVEQFLHPPLGALTPHLDYFGPYTGLQTISQWSFTAGPVFTPLNVSDSFGVQVTINGPIPAGWGFTNGWVSPDTLYDEAIYDNQIAQVVVQHQFLGGSWVSTQVVPVHSFPIVIFWEVAFPGRIGLLVAPGLSVDLAFLLVN